jgi:hypothetical protein
MELFNHPIFNVILAAAVGFAAKYLWDRWFSQSSRVTKKECELMRSGCTAIREFNKKEFMRLFEEQDKARRDRAEEEDEYCEQRKHIRGNTMKMLRVIMMTQLSICSHLKLDCSDVSKALVEMGEVD